MQNCIFNFKRLNKSQSPNPIPVLSNSSCQNLGKEYFLLVSFPTAPLFGSGNEIGWFSSTSTHKLLTDLINPSYEVWLNLGSSQDCPGDKSIKLVTVVRHYGNETPTSTSAKLRVSSYFSRGQSRWRSSCLPQQFHQVQVLWVSTEMGVIISLQYCIQWHNEPTAQ